ncbi:MAG: hypothetical protein K2K64_07140 [Muribaculaceae bacterium]|nr:hypothetical protein [Muribaculaceae bacterium]
MARHPVSASERRGILVVAALALLITASGIITSECSRIKTADQEPTMTVIDVKAGVESQDSAKAGTTVRKDSLQGKGKKRKGSSSSRSPKSYRRRNPLDEPV